jgi:hypothetical protein
MISNPLKSWDGTAPILCSFGPTAHAERHGWVDAATSPVGTAGCGGVYFDSETCTLLGFYRPWTEDENKVAMRKQRVSTGWLETRAILMWLTLFGSFCECRRTLLRTDSEAAMRAFTSAFSSADGMLELLRDSRLIVGSLHMMLRVRQVRHCTCVVVCLHYTATLN